MKIDILTLFPQAFSPLNTSIIGRAQQNGLVEINVTNFRDYSLDPHHSVDDTCYGGGQGMLIKPQPLFDAIEDKKTDDTKIVFLTPSGKVFNNEIAKKLSKEKHLLFICGHYEGIDQRVIDKYVDEEISIGDYVTTCGELPTMVVIDALCRFIPGVLHNEESAQFDSFENNLLEHPQYTRPADFRGLKVPEILISGNHEKIFEWQQKERIERTKKVRPDLYQKYLETKE